MSNTFSREEALKNCHLVSHPLLHHKLTKLREKKTTGKEFRNLVTEISRLLAYEATRDLSLGKVDIETPLEKSTGLTVNEELIVVPILRAGMGMLEGFLEILPFAKVGHVGIYRDKFINNTVEYYFRMPGDIAKSPIIILDPLLATGSTAIATINRLKEYGAGSIKFLSLLTCCTGISNVKKAHPDVELYTISLERELNEKGYLLPGIGDAGDRLYGTF